MANYYECYSTRHSEHTCLSYYYFNRKFTRDKWCSNCNTRYPERMGTNV